MRLTLLSALMVFGLSDYRAHPAATTFTHTGAFWLFAARLSWAHPLLETPVQCPRSRTATLELAGRKALVYLALT